jgi:hypothetical protein
VFLRAYGRNRANRFALQVVACGDAQSTLREEVSKINRKVDALRSVKSAPAEERTLMARGHWMREGSAVVPGSDMSSNSEEGKLK